MSGLFAFRFACRYIFFHNERALMSVADGDAESMEAAQMLSCSDDELSD